MRSMRRGGEQGRELCYRGDCRAGGRVGCPLIAGLGRSIPLVQQLIKVSLSEILKLLYVCRCEEAGGRWESRGG